MLWDMFSKWLEIGSMKQFFKKSLQHCIQGVNHAHATLEKSPVFMNGCCKHCFLAANAGLWIRIYQLQEIAWNLDLSRMEVEWNLPCHSTSFCFFFKICPHPWVILQELLKYKIGKLCFHCIPYDSLKINIVKSIKHSNLFYNFRTLYLYCLTFKVSHFFCGMPPQKWYVLHLPQFSFQPKTKSSTQCH